MSDEIIRLLMPRSDDETGGREGVTQLASSAMAEPCNFHILLVTCLSVADFLPLRKFEVPSQRGLLK